MCRGIFLLAGALLAQAPDPVYEPLRKAYEALRNRNYEEAVAFFLVATEAEPGRVPVRKDLAYTYLKIGETELARDQFREAMRLDPQDHHVALEYAFLCNETRQVAQARRIFDRVRRVGDAPSRATAEQAFQNVDGPLAEGIERWRNAIAMGAENFSAHYELATLAERRDELELAARHYERAWRLLPARRSVLVDLGRVWKALNRLDDAYAALLAASRGGEARAAESARELLPERYPYVPEFRKALEMDADNIELRRELAYLLLKMERQREAEEEFRIISARDENDVLSAAQLGFLYLGRGARVAAMPLLERVLSGDDEELSNRVRAVLRMPQSLRRRTESSARAASLDARLMAERSITAGYMKDALKYLQIAHEADPVDFDVMLKLGWTYNALRDDVTAMRWFALARKSPDVRLAAQASRAYGNLRPAFSRVVMSGWVAPVYSSRWRDLFSYGQLKAEPRVGLPFHPYFSLRFIGDTRRTLGPGLPQNLSESSVITALGISSDTWRGFRAWAEAGTALNYLNRHVLSDYRGGVAWARGWGRPFGASSPGWFGEINSDGVFVSRFGDDFLIYAQGRYGYTTDWSGVKLQLYCNSNLTLDARREYWANFAEIGPGVRFRWTPLPENLHLNMNLLRGIYTINTGNPRRPNFVDFRAGFGYAFRY